jgi:hypothetical protein
MSVVDHRLKLFENIARLRRVASQMPGNEDLAAVRAALEEELGPTVSQRLAGRILGVSHVALRRWIESGDLPLVHTTKGRREVPVAALLRLRDDIEEDQGSTRHRYVITPTMKRHHRAAKAFKIPKGSMRPDGPRVRTVGLDGPHMRAGARSLVYHQAVARRLRKSMVEEARHVLYRWRQAGKIDEHYAERWEEVLDRPIAEIRKAIVEESATADDLRQNSPFAGQLSEAERRRILKEVV